jgi:hypothetical protein
MKQHWSHYFERNNSVNKNIVILCRVLMFVLASEGISRQLMGPFETCGRPLGVLHLMRRTYLSTYHIADVGTFSSWVLKSVYYSSYLMINV